MYFVVRVRCRRKESSRSLSHFLMSFLYIIMLLWWFIWCRTSATFYIQPYRPSTSPNQKKVKGGTCTAT